MRSEIDLQVMEEIGSIARHQNAETEKPSAELDALLEALRAATPNG